MTSVRERGFNIVARSLVESYPDVTPDMIKEAHEDWKQGKEPKGIVQRFAFDEFDKPQHRHIFGEKDKA